jgi:hypothetical protein
MASRGKVDGARSLLLGVKEKFTAEPDTADLTSAAKLLTCLG